MTQRTKLFCVALTILFAGAIGCGQKLNIDRTITVGPMEVQSILVDAPKGDQKLTVDVSSPGVPVNVYVVFDADQQAVKDLMLAGKAPDASKFVAGQQKVEAVELTTLVPAGKAFGVMIGGAKKKTDVKVKVKGI